MQQDIIETTRKDIETLAHGRKLMGTTECPQCKHYTLTFRTNDQGKVASFTCATHNCIRYTGGPQTYLRI